MRETGVARIRLAGDKALAQKYISLARTLLGKLKARLAGAAGSHSWSFDNGVKISAATSPAGDILEIDATSIKNPCQPVEAELFGIAFEYIPMTGSTPHTDVVFKPIPIQPKYEEYVFRRADWAPEIRSQLKNYGTRQVDSCGNIGAWYPSGVHYGNNDWVGPNGEILSWDGGHWGRGLPYWNEATTPIYVGTPYVFRDGRRFAQLPSSLPVRGAAFRTIGGVKYLYVLSNSALTGTAYDAGGVILPKMPFNDLLYRKVAVPSLDTSMLDGDHPNGWELVHTFTPIVGDYSEYRIYNPTWFFNQSGTEAVQIRGVEDSPVPLNSSSTLTAVVKINVPALTKTILTSTTGTIRTVSSFVNTNDPSHQESHQEITSTGQVIAADYIGDALVYATAERSRLYNSTEDHGSVQFGYTNSSGASAASGTDNITIKINGATVISESTAYSASLVADSQTAGTPPVTGYPAAGPIDSHVKKMHIHFIDVRYGIFVYTLGQSATSQVLFGDFADPPQGPSFFSSSEFYVNASQKYAGSAPVVENTFMTSAVGPVIANRVSGGLDPLIFTMRETGVHSTDTTAPGGPFQVNFEGNYGGYRTTIGSGSLGFVGANSAYGVTSSVTYPDPRRTLVYHRYWLGSFIAGEPLLGPATFLTDVAPASIEPSPGSNMGII